MDLFYMRPRHRVRCGAMSLSILTGFTRVLLNLLGYGLLGAFIALLIADIRVREIRPNLAILHHVDLDTRRQCVDAVFKQFLNDVGGTLNDFTGGDFVDHCPSKVVNSSIVPDCAVIKTLTMMVSKNSSIMDRPVHQHCD